MTNSPAERVAAEVRGHLARQRKTQGDLATALNMSQQAVSRRLRGETAFDVDELSRIAAYLGVTVISLIVETSAA